MQTSFTVSAISNHFICSPLPHRAVPLSTIITYTSVLLSALPRPPLLTQFHCKVSTFNRQARARKNDDDDQIAAPQVMTRKVERTPSCSPEEGGKAQPEAEFHMAINNYFEKSVAILYGSVIQYARTFAD